LGTELGAVSWKYGIRTEREELWDLDQYEEAFAGVRCDLISKPGKVIMNFREGRRI